MIHIKVDRGSWTVAVTGHSGTAPAGRDIVCAGVSALVCTLAENASWLDEANALERFSVSLEPGRAEIVMEPKEAAMQAVWNRFEAVVLGLEMLAGEFKNAIEYEEAVV